jgi:hypothetical protein
MTHREIILTSLFVTIASTLILATIRAGIRAFNRWMDKSNL